MVGLETVAVSTFGKLCFRSRIFCVLEDVTCLLLLLLPLLMMRRDNDLAEPRAHKFIGSICEKRGSGIRVRPGPCLSPSRARSPSFYCEFTVRYLEIHLKLNWLRSSVSIRQYITGENATIPVHWFPSRRRREKRTRNERTKTNGVFIIGTLRPRKLAAVIIVWFIGTTLYRQYLSMSGFIQ